MKKVGIGQLFLTIFCTAIITYTITAIKIRSDVYANNGHMMQSLGLFEQEYSYDTETFEKLSRVKTILEKKYQYLN